MTATVHRAERGWKVVIDSRPVGTFRTLESAIAFVEHEVARARENGGRRAVA